MPTIDLDRCPVRRRDQVAVVDDELIRRMTVWTEVGEPDRRPLSELLLFFARDEDALSYDVERR